MEINKNEIESIKRSTRNRAYLAIISLALFAIVLAAWILGFSNNEEPIFTKILIFLLYMMTISFILMAIKRKKYRSLYKDYYVRKSINEVFDNAEYYPQKGISYEFIASTKMLNMGDIFNSSDYVKGEYKNVSFELSDIHIQNQIVVSDGETTTTEYVTIFRGRWIIFDFNKEFRSNIRVCAKNFIGKGSTIFSKLKRIKMESESFNKRFDTYSDNEHDTFYVLTPQLMEKIEELSNSLGGRIMLCFINNKLHVAVNNGRDNFEPISVFSKKTDEEIISSVKNELRQITIFVDKLNIDRNLFKGD